MELQEFVNLFQNTGVTIVIIAYFMYRDYKFLDTLQNTLTALSTTVEHMEDLIKEQKK